ncbi:MAG: sigma factor-like helix-turn-helix DNA-binding protein, partial [Phycisphaerales bacterium]
GGDQTIGVLEEDWMAASKGLAADEQYEMAVFRAKVEAAIKLTEKEAEFADFSIFSMRVLEGKPGKEVAAVLGISEPTVSRRLAKVRDVLRTRLSEVMAVYSFTPEEFSEAARNGLETSPKQDQAAADALFDEAVGEIYHRQMELRREDQAARLR